ncbi:uncharacterized protein F5Z01DRAFT_468777 [Emericellopsis atlantica]|uniref:Uncharacterized protein n=1 Tax=Emericellopsis atlantica TaxID=2614577 RepID=A0A9P8CK88_9HYPO|nr:uncharacterized protein F5Z01DRAFT_468777 [Emericellopsis atlantica]KAG9249690.1 hypothetical protein F5Z01DRAFT_468777 [Emericellopsis atlantica]
MFAKIARAADSKPPGLWVSSLTFCGCRHCNREHAVAPSGNGGIPDRVRRPRRRDPATLAQHPVASPPYKYPTSIPPLRCVLSTSLPPNFSSECWPPSFLGCCLRRPAISALIMLRDVAPSAPSPSILVATAFRERPFSPLPLRTLAVSTASLGQQTLRGRT